jgi:exodeoxyribonuclease VII small subunit
MDEARTNAPDLAFEVALERLESIVDRLERGDLELEGALAAFEEGVALTRHCADQLEQAERRIDVLVREGARWTGRPFEADADVPEASD